MKKLIIALAAWLCVTPAVHAANVDVRGMRVWPAPDSTRVVFDLTAPVDYRLFQLENPRRVVIDFRNTRLNSSLARPSSQDAIMQAVRHARQGERDLRVVLDLGRQIEVKSFLLPPNESYGHRLVVDLFKKEGRSVPVQRATEVRGRGGMRDVVIAIDAGHGGEDPGARGYSGGYEKDLVLAIARRLEALVEKEPGMRPVMIRTGDYFMSLRDRTRKAREHKADLFISVHADAFHDRRVRGTSLYVLSQGGASSEAARWLAARANASDLVGGVSLDDKDNVLASVLLDLSQSATIDASYEAGTAILRHMGPLGKLHKPTVQQAGFAVLKSPDIPSVLVETAFISNPDDEGLLRNPRQQQALAEAMLRGIQDYFFKYPPEGTLYASNRHHVIARGDTLSQLAQQYRVSVDKLRAMNQLNSDVLRVGQVLRIPGGEG